MREAPAVVRYPVRTPSLYRVVVVVCVAIALAGAWLFGSHVVLATLTGSFSSLRLVDALLAILMFAPLAYLFGTPEYRVGAGDRAIEISTDSILVPGTGRHDLRFDPRQTSVLVTEVRVNVRVYFVPVGSVERGVVIDFVQGALDRRISSLTLVRPHTVRALLDDLARVGRGEAPLGPDATPPAGPEPDDEDAEHQSAYDDALDRELDDY